ncbi:MAG: hypothetical protein IKE55_11805 [Kiritimatiellae bacterium]|nr:hypothetical protein [Kiritimatiellia bacterium]
MRFFWLLAVGAAAVLGAAAVWMGGLNQDEGWYLYAANLVAEGKMPYRDFFFTQGPMLPIVYSAFAWAWKSFGMLGARVFTLAIGAFGILLAAVLARRLAPEGRRGEAAVATALLLGSNLYHLYFVTIPKTYALAALFVMAGFLFIDMAQAAWNRSRGGFIWAFVSGLSLAFAAGTRISLGAILCVVGTFLLVAAVRGREWRVFAGFVAGGFGGLALVYGPFVVSDGAREGLLAAQAYHTAREGGGHAFTWIVGSLSRLVRWYLPVFVVLGLGYFRIGPSHRIVPARMPTAMSRTLWMAFLSFLAVFFVQMKAPFPYEDYQVPIMGLLAVFAVVMYLCVSEMPLPLVALGMTWALSFGSPLLEKWSTNGQDRFWSLKKDKYELAQLRDVAKRIEKLDPGGKELFTQDVYLAIETDRRVPKGFEMGPFAMLSDADIAKAVAETEMPVAALSGYTFAIEPPACTERPLDRQMEYWEILKRRYELVESIEAFGQNATTLLILKRK